MKYTFLFKKVIREVVSLITIVLFIYTCTKIRTAAGHRRTAGNNTISAHWVTGFNWPERITTFHPMFMHEQFTVSEKKKVFFSITITTSNIIIAGANAVDLNACYQVVGVESDEQ